MLRPCPSKATPSLLSPTMEIATGTTDIGSYLEMFGEESVRREVSLLLGCAIIVAVATGGCSTEREANIWEIVIDGPALIDEAGLSFEVLWWVSVIPDTISDGVWVFAPARSEVPGPPRVLLCSTLPKRILRVLDLEVPGASAPDEWLAMSLAVDSTGNIYVVYVRAQEWWALVERGHQIGYDVQLRHRLVVFNTTGGGLSSVDVLFSAEPNCTVVDMVVIDQKYVGLLWQFTLLDAPWNWIELRSSDGQSLWTVRSESDGALFHTITVDLLPAGVLLAEDGIRALEEGCIISRFDQEGQSLAPYRLEGQYFVGSDRCGHLYTIDEDQSELLRSDVKGRILQRVTLPTFAEDSLGGWGVSPAGDLYVWGWGEGDNGEEEPENFAIWRLRGSPQE